MRTGSIFLFGLCLVMSARAQERFGILHSNYAGNDATALNPARAAGQWPYADIRVAGIDLFAWNSLVAWSAREQRLLGEVRSGMAGRTAGEVVLRGSMINGTHRGFEQVDVLGPAFSLSLGRGTIGAGVKARSFTSITGVSSALGNFIFYGLGYRPQHGIRYHEEGVRVLSAAWTEFAVSYAHIVRAEGFGLLSAGAELQYKVAHAGGALQFNSLDFTVVDSAQLIVHEATATYGLAMPATNAGIGWGANVGFTYERTLEEADGYMPHRSSGGCDPLRYRYRIGLSLIDLGGLRFKQAEAGVIDGGTTAIEDYTDIPIESAADLDSLLGTATHWSEAPTFKIGAPTAVSLQYDQRVTTNAYLSLAAVQAISSRNSLRLRRANAMAITPRWETRYFEVGMPVTVREYDVLHPSLGLMLRFNGLVIGTDHIAPFINQRDVSAVDVYFRVRWIIHRGPFCKGKRTAKGSHRTGSKEPLPCATPNG